MELLNLFRGAQIFLVVHGTTERVQTICSFIVVYSNCRKCDNVKLILLTIMYKKQLVNVHVDDFLVILIVLKES